MKIAHFGAGFKAAAFALAALSFGGVTNVHATKQINTVNEVKGRVETKKSKEHINVNAIGGLDFKPLSIKDYGMSPREYGLRFGTGKSKNGKTNYQRMSHNAKLKRRS